MFSAIKMYKNKIFRRLLVILTRGVRYIFRCLDVFFWILILQLLTLEIFFSTYLLMIDRNFSLERWKFHPRLQKMKNIIFIRTLHGYKIQTNLHRGYNLARFQESFNKISDDGCWNFFQLNWYGMTHTWLILYVII